jgi:hypothetical protein
MAVINWQLLNDVSEIQRSYSYYTGGDRMYLPTSVRTYQTIRRRTAADSNLYRVVLT